MKLGGALSGMLVSPPIMTSSVGYRSIPRCSPVTHSGLHLRMQPNLLVVISKFGDSGHQ